MRATILAIALLSLSACGKGDNEPGPGGVTVGEAKALDEAAQMIEDDRLPPEAVPTLVPPPASAAPGAAVKP